MSTENSKILRLTSENVKRLQVVQITPDGNVVVIAGKNGQGKSSVLDSIMYGLGGAATFAKEPVRKGESKAKVVIELDTLIITRTISANGNQSLVVTSRDGAKYSSPQAMLDAMVGKLTFDPLEFSRQSPTTQSDTLRRLAGLDFTAKKTERQGYYDTRTAVNRQVKSLENQIAALPAPRAGVPAEEQSAQAILDAQQKATAVNTANAEKRAELAKLNVDISTHKTTIQNGERDIKELEEQIAALQNRISARRTTIDGITKKLTELESTHATLTAEVAKLEDVDLSRFSEELKKVESVNREVRGAAQRKKLSDDLKAEQAKADRLTKQMEEIDNEIALQIKNAKYPVAGLSVDASGAAMFNDLPLEQASSAEQLRVSVAIGLALNPKLRVLLVRDGSLLDEDSRALLLHLAQENDAQVWIEQVGTQGDVSVVIEDGMVKETAE
jgi:DNA repair exonuclease SbcCD ATPase subunit